MNHSPDWMLNREEIDKRLAFNKIQRRLQIKLRLPVDLHKTVTALAKENGCSLNQQLLNLVTLALCVRQKALHPLIWVDADDLNFEPGEVTFVDKNGKPI